MVHVVPLTHLYVLWGLRASHGDGGRRGGDGRGGGGRGGGGTTHDGGVVSSNWSLHGRTVEH